jgi:hypothetical protein
MRQKIINQFMWGYQEHFRIILKFRANQIMEALGARCEVQALLIGALRPGHQDCYDICVEPEHGQWPSAIFDGLLSKIELVYTNHPLQGIIYGDEPSMRDKPENTRRDSVSIAVKVCLNQFDADHDVVSFCGDSMPVGNYYVVPVVQVPGAIFRQFPPLRARPSNSPFDRTGHPSIVHSALSVLLSEACNELAMPEPGRHTSVMRETDEVLRSAARIFIHSPGLAIDRRYIHTALFDWCNSISAQMYEGAQSRGQILLANPQNAGVELLATFKHPIPLNDSRWTRKSLQFTSPDAHLVADSNSIYGIGRLRDFVSPDDESVFSIRFLDRFHWELATQNRVLMRSRYGTPRLPQEPIEEKDFVENFHRIFPDGDADLAWLLFRTAIEEDHGSMIVFTNDAASEAERLSRESTLIEPVTMSPDLFRQFSRIDGAILVDAVGRCHAVGVILDGAANANCLRSRGSRYNSAVRYVRSGSHRFAIVISDDSTTDLLPELRPLISAADIERNITALEQATTDDFYPSRNWLDRRRFYLDQFQCDRINSAMERIDHDLEEEGALRTFLQEFKPDDDMDASYIAP